MITALRVVVTGAGLLAMLGGLVGCAKTAPHDPQKLDTLQIMEETSHFQREILADGVVTFAEYERAIMASIECIRGEGITVDGPKPRNGDARFLTYFMIVEGVEHERASELVEAATEKCEPEFSRDVDRVWEYQNLLTPAQRGEQRRLVIECLQTAGVDVADNATDDEVFRAIADSDRSREAEVHECRERYPDYFVVGVK